MKRIFVLVAHSTILFIHTLTAQDIREMQGNARTFMLQGDYANAILILNRALQSDPQNIETLKNLALNYYFQKNYPKALETIKPVLDMDAADDQCYQIAGNIYQAMGEDKDAEKLYRKGLKKLPQSGPLYNDLGEVIWNEDKGGSIAVWEKGIESDPGYSRNYLNAAKYYSLAGNRVWSILYSEIYLNMEPLSTNTPEIKSLLLENYKQLFENPDLSKAYAEDNKFGKAFVQIMNQESILASTGINTETLTMIRTRFILDWFDKYARKFPFRLFEYHRQLLQNGLFEAYNQWLFAPTQNLPSYQNWINLHTAEYDEFIRFQKGRIFRIPQGEFYR